MAEKKIKLNLGCGHYLWPGFINVDMPGNYSGKEPDVKTDLKTLPFVTGYADEAYAIHVIEHFYEYEVHDVLKEWFRVLKPGGAIILECPDLRKVIEHFVKGFEDKQLPISRTLWALYGDPSYKDPAMVHKWCYAEEDLGNRLVNAGFEQVFVGPPQFHKENRDMRLVARKPVPKGIIEVKKVGLL